MIEQTDIVSSNVICDRINLNINREKVITPGTPLDIQVSATWGIYAIRQDNKSIKSKIKYILKSTLLEGEIDVTVTVDLIRAITTDEVSQKENQKEFALLSVNSVVSLVADLSSKMGISPLVIPTQVLANLIKEAK